MSYQYVMSGLSFILPTIDVYNSAEFVDISKRAFSWMQGVEPNHTFGVLFNAYKERRIGKKIWTSYSDDIPIYADSGGLQMITLGENAGDAEKAQVYKTQGEFSHFGMSFDEIPLTTSGDSGVNDTSARFFNYELFQDKARETGENLKKQIISLQEQGGHCRPFLIAHGNSIPHYKEWIDRVLDAVGPEHSDYIGGLALGSASLGFGELEDFTRAFVVKTLDIPEHIKSHVHILGVGSSQRLLPMLSYDHPGLVSYDSTSHSSADSFFAYQLRDARVSYKGGRSARMEVILDDIESKNKELGVDIDRGEMRMFNMKLRSEIQFTTESRWRYDTFKFLVGLYNVANFMGMITDLKEDNRHVIDILGEKYYHAFESFRHVSDMSQFTEWENTVGRSLISRRIRNKSNVTSLRGLFG